MILFKPRVGKVIFVLTTGGLCVIIPKILYVVFLSLFQPVPARWFHVITVAQTLCLSPLKTKNKAKMQEKQNQKVVFISLSIHTNFKHEEHTQKKLKA